MSFLVQGQNMALITFHLSNQCRDFFQQAPKQITINGGSL
jgi:hypothetical protein